jgi:hypothetical protein
VLETSVINAKTLDRISRRVFAVAMTAPVTPTRNHRRRVPTSIEAQTALGDLHCMIVRVVVTKRVRNRRVITRYDDDFPE